MSRESSSNGIGRWFRRFLNLLEGFPLGILNYVTPGSVGYKLAGWLMMMTRRSLRSTRI